MNSKILIVEDEMIEAMGFQQSLKSFGYDVVGIASTGEDALKKAAELGPDLVLMDVVLKGEIDGIEAAAKIKEDFDIPVIYLTAHPEKSVLKRAKLTLPNGYLIKPVNRTELSNTIELALYKHQMDKTIHASEKRFFSVTESMIDGLIITHQGIIDYANPAMVQLLRADSVDELLGKNFLDFLTPISREIALQEMERKQKGKAFTENLKEYELKPIKGSPITCEVKISSIELEGKIYGVSIYHEITDIKRSEKARSKSEENYKKLITSMNEGVAVHKVIYNNNQLAVDYEILDVNPAYEEILGIDKNEVIGKKGSEIYGTGKPPYLDIYLEVAKTGDPTEFKTYFEPMKKHFQISVFSPSPGMFATIFEDITEHQKAEYKLKESAERFRAVAESAVDGIVTTDEDGNIIFFNHSLMKIFGYEKEEIAGKSLTILMPDRFKKTYLDELDKFKESGEHRLIGKTASTTGLRKDGTEFPFEMSLASWKSKGKTYFTSIIRDVTDQKIAEEQINDQLKKLTILNKVIDMANKATNIDDLLRDIVHSTMELLGFNSGGIYLLEENKRFVELVYHENFPSPILENHNRKNIKEMPFSKLFSDKKPHYYDSKRYPSIIRTGFKSVAIVPLHSADKIIGSISIASNEKSSVTELEIDILESIGLEAGTVIAKMYSEKATKDSLKEKETLLKEIHHRVKNNLQIISSLLDLQESYVKEDPTAVSVLKESQNRVLSMAMIHEMLYQSKDLSHIKLSDYIRNMVSNLFHSYGTKSTITPTIKVDDISLNIETAIPCGLIISELVSNSLKYAYPNDAAGELFISLRPSNDELELIISDNGIGLPKELDIKKAESSLGLRLVNSLIKQLDGTIELDRTQGTKYTIKFQELKYKKRI